MDRSPQLERPIVTTGIEIVIERIELEGTRGVYEFYSQPDERGALSIDAATGHWEILRRPANETSDGMLSYKAVGHIRRRLLELGFLPERTVCVS